MLSSKQEHVNTTLDEMWETHRDYLRRCLIGLTRDIDLADDLLQETYLRARDGICGYRGGDARAWLAAIARNVYFAHTRRRYYSSEIPLEANEHIHPGAQLGSTVHVDLIALRQAICDLPPALRDALVLKHYAGLTYNEIAERLNCPQGTAQQRVWTAIRRLRAVLGVITEVSAAMKCSELVGKMLVDYLYGKLPEAKAAAVREHLANCQECREEADETAAVLRALDAVQDGFKMTSILDFDEDGHPMSYSTMSDPNLEHEPVDIWEFGAGRDTDVLYAAQDGDEAQVEELPTDQSETYRRYRLHLPHTVGPGARIHLLLVARTVTGAAGAENLGNGIWQVGPGRLDYRVDAQDVDRVPNQMAYVTAVRIPEGARLVEATPEPTEVKTNSRTTVYWRSALAANQEFEFRLKYRL